MWLRWIAWPAEELDVSCIAPTLHEGVGLVLAGLESCVGEVTHLNTWFMRWCGSSRRLLVTCLVKVKGARHVACADSGFTLAAPALNFMFFLHHWVF